MIGINKKEPVKLEKNVPSSIEGIVEPQPLQFLKKIFIIDTDDKKSKMEKDSVIKIQKRATELAKVLEDEVERLSLKAK